MNKTKSNKKKSCRQVTSKKRELDEARNSRPVWPCEPLCAILPEATGTDTAQAYSSGFGPVFES